MIEPLRAVPQTWTRATIAPADWTVPLPETAKRELLAVRDELRRAPVPTFLLDPKDFQIGQALVKRLQQRRRGFRMKNGTRMRVKGYRR